MRPSSSWLVLITDQIWVLTSGGSTSFGGILAPSIVLGVVSVGLGLESVRIIIGGLLNAVWSCLVIASWVYTCARERVGNVPYLADLSLGKLLSVAIPVTIALVLIELVYQWKKEPIKALVTQYFSVERFTNTAKRVVLSPVKTVVAMKFEEALSVIRFIRVQIPTTPRFRASFRLSVSKVVIARCTSILIYGASWVGVSGPVLTPSYPEDLVVFFAVVNMVSSLLIALTFIITSNLKTANA